MNVTFPVCVSSDTHNNTCNTFSSTVQPSQFNIKISKIVLKLYRIFCRKHPFHSKKLPFYLIWIQKDFMFGCFQVTTVYGNVPKSGDENNAGVSTSIL